MQFPQYSVVRVLGFCVPPSAEDDGISRRPPRVGDIACVVEVYSDPPGYEIECTADDGTCLWLHSFKSTDVQLELVKQ